jgi:hypothetical protein
MTTAGIDVSKAHLDLALLGPSYHWTYAVLKIPDKMGLR